jgi:hypothetical protein
MTRQNIVLLVSVQRPLAGTSPPALVTVVLNRPLIRSIEIGTDPLFKELLCKNEISVGVTTTLLAGDPFPSRISLRLSSNAKVNGDPCAQVAPES